MSRGFAVERFCCLGRFAVNLDDSRLKTGDVSREFLRSQDALLVISFVYPYLYNIHKLIDKHKNPITSLKSIMSINPL